MDSLDNSPPTTSDSLCTSLDTSADDSHAELGARLARTELLLSQLNYTNNNSASLAKPDTMDKVRIWGIPLARLNYDETLDQVDRLIEKRQPTFFITANLHYAMLSANDRRLQEINEQAAFIVADGMPMVWYSRLSAQPLPERVAGSDLIYLLNERAAQRHHRVFLLGGAEGVAEKAAAQLRKLYPTLTIVGIESPTLDSLSSEQNEALVARIRQSKADLLFAALGQPKGELWLDKNLDSLGVPVCVQVGASFDFVAGQKKRAPRWVQRLGIEWLHRIQQEPKRLLPRYRDDICFLFSAIGRDIVTRASAIRFPWSS